MFVQTIVAASLGVPAHVDLTGITLASPAAMMIQDDPELNSNPLSAIEEGMDDEENIDMFRDLDNIKDVEMSTDSTKIKRAKDGEECSSHS